MRSHTLWKSLVIPLALCVPSGAIAGDGVGEINEACAVSTGCFPGDTPGYPVTITQSGSYRLTGSLTPSGLSANTDMVSISATDVTLDLNGFEIVHIQSCTNDPPTSCTLSGTGRGIAGGNHVTLRDGVVRNAVSHGIELGWFGSISGVRVSGCGGSGVVVANHSRIDDAIVASNLGGGVFAFQQISVKRSVISRNNGSGFSSVFGRNSLLENVINENVSLGLSLFSSDGYGLNHLSFNSGSGGGTGGQVSGGLNLGQNVCNAALCP